MCILLNVIPKLTPKGVEGGRADQALRATYFWQHPQRRVTTRRDLGSYNEVIFPLQRAESMQYRGHVLLLQVRR